MGIIFSMLVFVPLLALLVGGLFLVTFKRSAVLQKSGQWLSRPALQTPLRYGGLIFLFNAALFGATVLIVIGGMIVTSEYGLPAPMMLFAPLAVAASGISWIGLGRAWHGSSAGRAAAALIGSLFYWLLFAYGYYGIEQLSDQPDDSMADIGFLLLQFISFVAAVTCIVMAGWPRKTKEKRL